MKKTFEPKTSSYIAIEPIFCQKAIKRFLISSLFGQIIIFRKSRVKFGWNRIIKCQFQREQTKQSAPIGSLTYIIRNARFERLFLGFEFEFVFGKKMLALRYFFCDIATIGKCEQNYE